MHTKFMVNNILLSAENISKSFKKIKVLVNIPLDLPQGKITSILGSSGCGKITLLKIIAGVEKASKGKILSPLTLPGKEVAI